MGAEHLRTFAVRTLNVIERSTTLTEHVACVAEAITNGAERFSTPEIAFAPSEDRVMMMENGLRTLADRSPT